jgi:ATP-binding cassette subfamily B protein
MCAIILFALNLGNNGDFSRVVPVLGSLVLGAKKLLPTFQEGFTALAGIQGSRAALSKVLVSLKRSINPLSQANSLPTLSLEKGIRLDNIWFSYGGDTAWVLQGLNITIPAKTTVAFVGSTGSGKSTTADLILGLLPEGATMKLNRRCYKGLNMLIWIKMRYFQFLY